MKSFSESYKAAGVDITAGYEAVQLMKKHIARTKTAEVLSDIGGFGGMVLPNLAGLKEPVLVSGTDGVGTKLKLAFDLDKHDTVAVSYTHLDVYKRQARCLPASFPATFPPGRPPARSASPWRWNGRR